MPLLLEDTKKLTKYEWDGLSSAFNLADGHPRQPLLPDQQRALHDLGAMFIYAHEGHEIEAKQLFEQAFFGLAGQPSVHEIDSPIHLHSGSEAIELLANYLRLHNKRVAFLHPSFDSIADTMRRHGVQLIPLEENALRTLTPDSPRLPVDALYIVTPNNPTGRGLTKEQFEQIVAYCKKHNMLLLIDFCFRFYGEYWRYDQYRIMRDAGINFIAIEDTGKSWPAADIKVAMLVSSKSLYSDLKTIADDFLLGISPFAHMLLAAYIGVENPSTHRLKSQDVADKNRRVLRKILKGTSLKALNPKTTMSVEWVSLPQDWKAAHFSNELARHGVQVLPGERFYWNDNRAGQTYIRIALLREQQYFEQAIQRLRDIAMAYRP